MLKTWKKLVFNESFLLDNLILPLHSTKQNGKPTSTDLCIFRKTIEQMDKQMENLSQ